MRSAILKFYGKPQHSKSGELLQPFVDFHTLDTSYAEFNEMFRRD